MPDRNAHTSADDSLERLCRSGWKISLMASTDCSGETIWEIAGHQGENLFKVDGVSRREVWDNAVLAAAACGMLRGWPRPPHESW